MDIPEFPAERTADRITPFIRCANILVPGKNGTISKTRVNGDTVTSSPFPPSINLGSVLGITSPMTNMLRI
jgi:hypothetical protein